MRVRDRIAAMTPLQMTLLLGLGATTLTLLLITGLLTHVLKLLALLFIELFIRIARLIFRW